MCSGGYFQNSKLRCGVVAETRKANRALLDYDTRTHGHCGRIRHASRRHRVRLPRLAALLETLRIVGVAPRAIGYQRSRHGWHVTIDLRNRLLPAEQVALQCLLGSDVRRERLNLMRVIGLRTIGAPATWKNRWNLFYSRKLSS